MTIERIVMGSEFWISFQAFEIEVDGGISDLVAIREELMIATKSGKILR